MRNIIFLAIFVLESATGANESNVCSSTADYSYMEGNPSCWYNPDVESDTPEMIARHGYPLETVNVTTEDGYVLTMFRIPPRREPKGVVFLHHALLTYSGVWVSTGNQSLGFVLSDAGYDVWLANARGSRHSMGHQRYNTMEKSYWNFSFHEIGLYDVHAQLKTISEITGREDIAYVGHSMGATAALIYASLRPEEARSLVKVFVALAPGAIYEHYRTLVRPFLGIVDYLLKYVDASGIHGIQRDLTAFIFSKMLCTNVAWLRRLCYLSILLPMGGSLDDFEPEWGPIILAQLPEGASLKSIMHYIQLIASKGRFQSYDYGPIANHHHYGSSQPPEYPLGNITVPFYLIYGERDETVTPEDVVKLYTELPEEARGYGIKGVDLSHGGFVFGVDVRRKLYDHLVEFLDGEVFKQD